MLNKIVSSVSILSLVLSAGVALAQTNKVEVTNNGGVSFSLPAHAKAVSENVFSLGTAYDAEIDGLVEGYAIVHKKGQARGGSGKPGSTKCYGFFASGSKWKSAEPWAFNPSNNEGLDPLSLYFNFDADVTKWETAGSHNIFGAGSFSASTLIADESAPDSTNEVYFGSIADEGTIAVTIVWGIFSGPTFQRSLVEWDMIFDQDSFDWSMTGESTKMDFENIATHELGHAAGLIDLYTSACAQETMYGYATEGETQKRDLYNGDIQGISALY